MIRLTAFGQVPPFAQGLVRDLRVRWALEEAGLPYEERLLAPGGETESDAYRRLQPFGQVPVLEDGELVLFESGAIVLHIGASSETLLPADPVARARAVAWLFAAINTIEAAIQPLAELDLFHAEEQWAVLRRPAAQERVEKRLAELAAWLGERAYLEQAFTAGDLMMASVLRILRHTDLVARQPTLQRYLERCQERPAFQRALSDQMAPFRKAG